MKINSPCYECKDRKLGCHDKCQSYFNYKQELKKAKSKQREGRAIDEIYFRRREFTKYDNVEPYKIEF